MEFKPPSRKRALTAEEAELWAHVMRDAKALKRRQRAAERAVREDVPVPPPAVAASDGAAAPPPRPKTPAVPTSPVRPADPSPPQLADFEDRHRRKLARNVEAIDARLDLHGMRQREAHGALRAFLFASAARGSRNVLIITGKGTRAEIERVRDFMQEERGVLRRLVPQWLAEPEFRAIVLSYTAASVRHGGDGALYVRLRKLGHGL
jgi:DNA-nicking Smr family endonuclease